MDQLLHVLQHLPVLLLSPVVQEVPILLEGLEVQVSQEHEFLQFEFPELLVDRVNPTNNI